MTARRVRRCLGALLVAAGLGGVACDQALQIGHIAKPASGGASGGSGGDGGGSGDGSDGRGADAASDDGGGADGTAPNIVWSSDFEGGDLSDWMSGGLAVGGDETQGIDISVTEEEAHGGAHAFKMGFDTNDSVDHIASLWRRALSGTAYYSAWYFIAEAHKPTTYWQLMWFFYETEPGVASTKHGLWFVNIDEKISYFFNNVTKKYFDSTPALPYPVGRWFHLETRLGSDVPGSLHLTVWLDGTQVLDVPGLAPAPSDNVYWAIGSGTDHLTPTGCTIYIDDAAISLQRLGP